MLTTNYNGPGVLLDYFFQPGFTWDVSSLGALRPLWTTAEKMWMVGVQFKSALLIQIQMLMEINPIAQFLGNCLLSPLHLGVEKCGLCSQHEALSFLHFYFCIPPPHAPSFCRDYHLYWWFQSFLLCLFSTLSLIYLFFHWKWQSLYITFKKYTSVFLIPSPRPRTQRKWPKDFQRSRGPKRETTVLRFPTEERTEATMSLQQ